jgi:AcrR family transcriptional regulator
MAKGRPRAFDKDIALEQAMYVFWAKGFNGAALSDLIEAMNINGPSLYAAFESKEGLFKEVLDKYGRDIGDVVWGHLFQEPDIQQAIEKVLLSTAHEFTRNDRPLGCLIAQGAIESAKPEAICAELRYRRRDLFDKLYVRFSAAKAEGEISINADCMALAKFYSSVQQGMVIQARDGESKESLEAVAALAMKAWPSLCL